MITVSVKKGGVMKFYCAVFILSFFALVLAVTTQAAQMPSTQGSATSSTNSPSITVQLPGTGVLQIAERLFTSAVLEPNGFVAVCFATNLDSVSRDLSAQIVDSRGVDVTQTSSCGAQEKSGVTCDSTAHFSNNSPLRCVVGTSGRAATLRGGMTTSSGPFPFVSSANLVITAQ